MRITLTCCLAILLGLCCYAPLPAQFSEEHVLLDNRMHFESDLQIVADFNGDGKADYLFKTPFLIANYVVLSEGDGFSNPLHFDPSYDWDKASVSDYQQDGDLDIFFTATSIVYVLVNDGTGNFSLTYHQVPSEEFSLQDLDKDGDLDLFDDSSGDWYRNEGDYESFLQLYIGYWLRAPIQLLQGHFGNGPNTIDWLIQDQQGGGITLTLVRDVQSAIPSGYILFRSTGLSTNVETAVADLDGDDDLDVLILSQTDFGPMILQPLYQGDDGWYVDEAIGYVDHFPINLSTTDLNNDGLTDILYNEEDQNAIVSLINKGNGEFEFGGLLQPEPFSFALDPHENLMEDPAPIVLNNQGPFVSIYESSSGKLNHANTILDNPVGRSEFVYQADMNKDGRQDLLVYSSEVGTLLQYPLQGDFTFGAAQPVRTLDCEMVVLTDIGAEGDPDLLAFSETGSVTWLQGASFTDTIDQHTVYTSLQISTQKHIQAMDFYRDGEKELWVGDRLINVEDDGQISSRIFSFEAVNPSLSKSSYLTHLNADKLWDLVGYCHSDSVLTYRIQNPSGQFDSYNETLARRSISDFQACQLNNDPFSDAILLDFNSSQLISYIRESGRLQASDSLRLSEFAVNSNTDIIPMHLNSDALHDLVISSSLEGEAGWQLAYVMNEGEGKFAEPVILRDSNLGAIIHRIDIDSDGLDDIVYQNAKGSYLSYFINEGRTIPRTVDGLVKVHPNPVLDIVHLPASNSDCPQAFQVYDNMGRLMSEGSARGTVDVSSIGPGIYIISWKQGKDIFTAKFLKQ